MLKKSFTAFVCVLGLSAVPLAFVSTPVAAETSTQAEQLAAMQADIEALIVANAGDAEALATAIENYITNAADPELASQAAIQAVTDPASSDAQAALAANGSLKVAVGRGIGAAIAVVALTDPDAAANMQALVTATGDETLVASAQEGNDTKTASIQGGTSDPSSTVVDEASQDTTPENAASAS